MERETKADVDPEKTTAPVGVVLDVIALRAEYWRGRAEGVEDVVMVIIAACLVGLVVEKFLGE